MSTGGDDGQVYLIHFARKIGNPDAPKGQAQHYIGHTGRELAERQAEELGPNAPAILRAVNEAGIEWRVVRTWAGTKDTERQLKLMNAGNRLCPECTEHPLSGAGAVARAAAIRQARQAAREAARTQLEALAGRLPHNRDGSISRRRTTEAQKLAAGVMTAAQQAEHTALRHGAVTGKPARPAERGPLRADPWIAAAAGEAARDSRPSSRPELAAAALARPPTPYPQREMELEPEAG